MSDTIDRKARIRAFRRLFLGVAWDIWAEARLSRRLGIRAARARMRARHRRRAVQFRETASRLQGVVIKLGQFLSARADVMPEEYLQELSKLQDEVPPVSFAEVRETIEAEFGRPLEEVYATFEEAPIAAASLGQVHGATLADGTRVAVKVQRPGIRELCDVDLATFAWLMDGAHRFTRIGRQVDIPNLVAEFARTLNDELDFEREGSYAERFADNFRRHPIIRVPEVHWEYTTDRVLTLERVDGMKTSDYEALEAAGVERTLVADEVFQSYMQQVLVDGFFHADPHPGNLFVVADEDGPKITFVDFGMVGEIAPAEQAAFKEGVIAGSRRDYPALVSALQRLGFIRPTADVDVIARAIAFMFDSYSGTGASGHRIDFEALESIQEDIRALVYEHPFTLPHQFGFLGRAVGTMVGLVSGLDPSYDFISAVKPYVKRSTLGDPVFLARQARERLVAVGKMLLELPARLDRVDRVLQLVEKGDLSVRVGGFASDSEGERLSRLVTGFSIWAAALLIGGIVLYVVSAVDFAFTFWAVSIIVMIAVTLPSGRRRRGR